MCVVAVVLGMATIFVGGADSVACTVCGVAADAIADRNVGCRCRGDCEVLDYAAISGVRTAERSETAEGREPALPSQVSVVGVSRAGRRDLVVDGTEDDS